MAYDKELIAQHLGRWADFAEEYTLPAWETIPDFGLYMDQVVVLLGQYLSYIPPTEDRKDSFVTAAAINNYVRLKLMPPPVKKKYGRLHLCYLLMILTLKPALSISEIRQLLPADPTETAVQALYSQFCQRFDRTRSRFTLQLRHAAEELAVQPVGDANQMVLEQALDAACSTLLAGKIIALGGTAGSDPES